MKLLRVKKSFSVKSLGKAIEINYEVGDLILVPGSRSEKIQTALKYFFNELNLKFFFYAQSVRDARSCIWDFLNLNRWVASQEDLEKNKVDNLEEYWDNIDRFYKDDSWTKMLRVKKAVFATCKRAVKFCNEYGHDALEHTYLDRFYWMKDDIDLRFKPERNTCVVVDAIYGRELANIDTLVLEVKYETAAEKRIKQLRGQGVNPINEAGIKLRYGIAV